MAELNGMQGNEIADFVRKGSNQGRWRDTWEVFKGNFWKLVVLNLLTLVTFVPGITVIYIRAVYVANLGSIYPFNAGVGYPYYPFDTMAGLAESVNLSADILFYALLLVAGLIASIGISGSAYCIRKLLQTHGEFQIKSFFHGIKVGYFSTALPALVFMLFIYASFLIHDWMKIVEASGGNVPAAITAYVFIIIATVFAGIYLMWVFAVGVSYKVKFKYLLRNSFVLIMGTIIQTPFMLGFSLIPVWLLLLGGFWRIIGYIIFAFFGFSFVLICWLSYTQWAFDMYITPNIKAEKEAAKAQKSEKELAAEKAAEERQQALELLAAGKSELIARPILPIKKKEAVPCLGRTFTRSQLGGASENREKLRAEVAAYEKEHENDPVFAEYNRMFAEREKAIAEPEAKKNKKKKISADNLLR